MLTDQSGSRGTSASTKEQSPAMSRSTPRTPDGGETRGRKRSEPVHNAIIDASVAILGEVGYQALTMEGVAARAGVAKATVYRWWPTKAHLIIEAAGRDLGAPLESSGNTEHDIRALIEFTIDFVGGLLGEVFIADLARDPNVGAQLEDLLGPYRAAHASLLLAAAGRGDLPYTLDITAVLDLISGIILFRKLMKRPLDRTLADQLTALVLAGELPSITTPAAPGIQPPGQHGPKRRRAETLRAEC